ncbi:CYFA0S24e00452g1_1 [Cyberlindnera fabianii]|uniref:Histone-lysine N-methyltransferase SET5 n=1 Tax=Cyberlindnera fabianii TaxID=36022 RepID=A0A061BFC6_CYBFA|nr:CYFA0S24e00452g1_1 [Cyberlindnera fabianii]
MPDSETPNIEILTINDKPETATPAEPIVPHERQVVTDVAALWKEDPSTASLGVGKLHALIKERNPTWSLSEKRFKTILKKFNLLATSEQFTYAGDITSKDTPEMVLPKNIRYQFTKTRGKGLYASNFFKEGDLLWEEKSALFFVPPLDKLKLMDSGKACTYCGSLLQTATSTKKGLDCNVCSHVWCSQHCKKTDTLHKVAKHSLYEEGKKSKKVIIPSAWAKYENYCFKDQWVAAHAIAHIHAYCILDKTGLLRKQFDAFAKVRQDIRQKAADMNGGVGGSLDGSNNALFVQEQQEEMWKECLRLFNAIFPDHQITYDQLMEYLGAYNINNVDGSMFLIQAHLNHNCEPNVRVIFGDKKTDGIKVYAKRAIKANEELVTSYVNPAHEVLQRQRELRINWGFSCNCNKCKNDKKDIQRRKSNEAASASHKQAIKDMLKNSNNEEFELEVPDNVVPSGERRKSVRFDEKVVAVSQS